MDSTKQMQMQELAEARKYFLQGIAVFWVGVALLFSAGWNNLYAMHALCVVLAFDAIMFTVAYLRLQNIANQILEQS